MKDLNCVSDVHPPRFTSCPSNIEVFTKEIVTWDKPKVGDNVGINNIDFLGSQHNNTFFLSGSFLLGYIARDFEGNVAVCQFTVSVWEEGTVHCLSTIKYYVHCHVLTGLSLIIINSKFKKSSFKHRVLCMFKQERRKG